VTLPIRIHPNSGVPLYRQIANEVKAAFLRGFLRPGERLPSVRELAASHGLNPTTVVKAYDQLDRERLIVRRQGQGAFVAGGTEPLSPDERDERVERLADELALEGRRLGLSEAELVELLKVKLRDLRPGENGGAS
jgi:GntR family transcriptional regulator